MSHPSAIAHVGEGLVNDTSGLLSSGIQRLGLFELPSDVAMLCVRRRAPVAQGWMGLYGKLMVSVNVRALAALEGLYARTYWSLGRRHCECTSAREG